MMELTIDEKIYISADDFLHNYSQLSPVILSSRTLIKFLKLSANNYIYAKQQKINLGV